MRHAPPVPSVAEMADNCAQNAKISQGLLHRALEKRSMAGPAATDAASPNPHYDAANCEVSRHEADWKHWTELEAYYRRRASTEGPRTIPLTMRPGPGRRLEVVPPPAADPRLPREPEDDTWTDAQMAEELR